MSLPRPVPAPALTLVGLLAVVSWTAPPSPAEGAPGDLAVVELRTEYLSDPVGIDTRAPRLSWEIRGSRRGVTQSGYRIRVAATVEALRGGRTLWDSGRVTSGDSTFVPYGGAALASGRRYHWQVRVWDDTGQASPWSAPAYWEMGLLQASDWRARWIEPDVPGDPSKAAPSPLLRREFDLDAPIARARAYVTAHGLYEMSLNGKPVGDQLFAPGWTSYARRLQYQTYDVTALLRQGRNAVGAVLGDGWYRGELAWEGRRDLYGDRVGLLAQIVVTYVDGRQEVVTTDGKWKSSTGPILMSSIYDGETYDARLEKAGWSEAGFDDGAWSGVNVASYPMDNLIAPVGPPVRRIQVLRPVQILQTPAGDTVVDMGQNMVGWVRLTVQGPAGTTVTLRHAEVLDKEGNLYTANLRTAKETVRYTLKGGGPETYEPHFTFQGFRYVAVEGYPGALTPDSLTGVVIHSAMTPSSTFETSDPLVNQLQHNIRWGQKGNFLDIPTDCPQRNERLGWTGDAEVFCRTAAFNMDVSGFFAKWLEDLAADQYPSGSVPHVVPDALRSFAGRPAGGSAGWGDSAVIVPWTMYLTYGDKSFLERQYPSMVRWVAYENERAGPDHVWDGDFHFADWLAFTSTGMAASAYPGATTSMDYVATAFFAHSTDLLSRAARVLGTDEDARKYEDLLARIKEAFRHEYVTETGRVGENTQTAYALALQFDLLPEDLRASAADRLARDVQAHKHLTTGFLGTPQLCHALSRNGHLDEAYMLLNRKEYPSWLYPVTQGATTIWERWDGQRPDGSFQTPEMNSFNHYAYGAVGDWMYRVMAGIEIDERAPGYKHVLVQPQPGGGFTHVKASHHTPYGEVSSEWTIDGGAFTLAVEVPANSSATVRLPGVTDPASVTEGGKPLARGNGIGEIRPDTGSVAVDVGSGRYVFKYTRPSARPSS
jgi:alpha-L-rhamnosidase